MLEIIEQVLNLLKADTTLSGMIGSDEDDYRIYQLQPSENIQYSETKKAGIYYYISKNPQPKNITPFVQIPSFNFYFKIVSYDKTLLFQIEEYLFELLSPTENNGITTDNFKVGYIRNNGAVDGNNEGTPRFPLYSRILALGFESIFKRN